MIPQPVAKETPTHRINHGDPDIIMLCPACGIYHRAGQAIDRPDMKSWLRIYAENLWRYRWRFRLSIAEGGLIPIGFGLAWMEVNSLNMVMYPIPVNVIIRTLREFGLWMMRGGWRKFPSKQDEIDYEVAKRFKKINAIVNNMLDGCKDKND